MNADETDVLFEDQESLIENNLYAYCLNNPINMIDNYGYMAAAVASGFIAYGTTAGLANSWNPVGWVVLGVVGAVAVGVGIYYAVNAYKAKKPISQRNNRKKQARKKQVMLQVGQKTKNLKREKKLMILLNEY